jgi:hypothetical protein
VTVVLPQPEEGAAMTSVRIETFTYPQMTQMDAEKAECHEPSNLICVHLRNLRISH